MRDGDSFLLQTDLWDAAIHYESAHAAYWYERAAKERDPQRRSVFLQKADAREGEAQRLEKLHNSEEFTETNESCSDKPEH